MLKTAQLPMLSTRASISQESFNENDRTVELVWSTGAQVRRFDWLDGPYIEELSMDPSHIRMDRMNNGAPFLKNHESQDIDNVLGVSERGWVENGEGKSLIRFDESEETDKYLSKIKKRILRNVSVGYIVHEYEFIPPSERGGLPVHRAIDWEPLEVSLVAVNADASAQIRSHEQLHPVSITTRGNAMSDPENQVPAAEAPAPETPANEPTESAEQIAQRAIAQERTRISGIREMVRRAKLDDSVAEYLIESGTSLDLARDEVLRQWSDRVDASATPSGNADPEPKQSRSAELQRQLLNQVAGVK
jgi:hypothetical protein